MMPMGNSMRGLQAVMLLLDALPLPIALQTGLQARELLYWLLVPWQNRLCWPQLLLLICCWGWRMLLLQKRRQDVEGICMTSCAVWAGRTCSPFRGNITACWLLLF
jgi:hypothetical protein